MRGVEVMERPPLFSLRVSPSVASVLGAPGGFVGAWDSECLFSPLGALRTLRESPG